MLNLSKRLFSWFGGGKKDSHFGHKTKSSSLKVMKAFFLFSAFDFTANRSEMLMHVNIKEIKK